MPKGISKVSVKTTAVKSSLIMPSVVEHSLTPVTEPMTSPEVVEGTSSTRFSYTTSTRQSRLNEGVKQTLKKVYFQYPPIAKPTIVLYPLLICLFAV